MADERTAVYALATLRRQLRISQAGRTFATGYRYPHNGSGRQGGAIQFFVTEMPITL